MNRGVRQRVHFYLLTGQALSITNDESVSRENSGIGELLQSLNDAWVFTGGGIYTDTTIGV